MSGEDPMPTFPILGKDRLALDAIAAYHAACVREGLGAQAVEVAEAFKEIREWQGRNPGLVKTPDHIHVPAIDKVATGGRGS